MKRFTETLKWQDPWFRRLSPNARMLWIYLLDHCDLIGLVEIDPKLVSMDCGLPVKTSHISELGDRLQDIGGGKFFIPKFIPFQYGRLSDSCPPHKKVIESIKRHCLEANSEGYRYPNNYPRTRVGARAKDIEEGTEEEENKKADQEQEGADLFKVASKARGTLDEVRAFCDEIKLPVEDADYCFFKWEGNGWTNNGEKIKDWKMTIMAWERAGYMPSQKQTHGKKKKELSDLEYTSLM